MGYFFYVLLVLLCEIGSNGFTLWSANAGSNPDPPKSPKPQHVALSHLFNFSIVIVIEHLKKCSLNFLPLVSPDLNIGVANCRCPWQKIWTDNSCDTVSINYF